MTFPCLLLKIEISSFWQSAEPVIYVVIPANSDFSLNTLDYSLCLIICIALEEGLWGTHIVVASAWKTGLSSPPDKARKGERCNMTEHNTNPGEATQVGARCPPSTRLPLARDPS